MVLQRTFVGWRFDKLNFFTAIKSILLVLIIYSSLILNNSLSSAFTTEVITSSLFLGFIITDLLITAYRFVFSNQIRIIFNLGVYFVSLALCLVIPVLIQNLLVFLGLFVYIYISKILSRFASYEDQLNLEMVSTNFQEKNYTLQVIKGIIWNEYIVNYSQLLGFISTADKKNLFDLIKNCNGFISYTNDVSINFILKDKGLKWFSKTESKLKKNIKDIESMISNLLIEA